MNNEECDRVPSQGERPEESRFWERYWEAVRRHGKVAATTQNQALNALVFFFREGLKVDPGQIGGFEYAKRPRKLPVVLTQGETRRVLAALPLPWILRVKLLYGSGLRLMEGVRLRVQDVDMERCQIVVRDGKGAKDRVTMLAVELVDPLRKHLEWVRQQHERDLADGYGEVWLAWGVGPEVSRRATGMGMAMGVSVGETGGGSARREGAAASY